MNRALTPSGKAELATTFQRITALVFSLLTFCPPGPELRTKLKSTSERGIAMLGAIRRVAMLSFRSFSPPIKHRTHLPNSAEHWQSRRKLFGVPYPNPLCR